MSTELFIDLNLTILSGSNLQEEADLRWHSRYTMRTDRIIERYRTPVFSEYLVNMPYGR
jgi:hypothetical protein